MRRKRAKIANSLILRERHNQTLDPVMHPDSSVITTPARTSKHFKKRADSTGVPMSQSGNQQVEHSAIAKQLLQSADKSVLGSKESSRASIAAGDKFNKDVAFKDVASVEQQSMRSEFAHTLQPSLFQEHHKEGNVEMMYNTIQ